mmetsp:Transcript_27040/g.80187  ORF Transcript_27040/g.80187 Transcript_27040/m.80187 type:complete len:273 (+) Transcript_27040:681-1499(+)
MTRRMLDLTLVSRARSSSPIGHSAGGASIFSYSDTMRGSALARTISISSIVPWKKGQLSYMSESTSSPLSSNAFSSASPMPSHTGRCSRVCVHAKIHGMARSVPTPPPGFRLAGRLPMLRPPSSDTGVAVWKYGTKSGFWNTMPRYSLHEMALSLDIISRHSGFGARGGSMHASRTADVYTSSVRKQTSGSPNCCSMISPCTVTRSVPSIVPAGCERIAMCVGPPPRPTVPPRPWNSTSLILYSCATATSFSCASKSAHAAARRPASLPESE